MNISPAKGNQDERIDLEELYSGVKRRINYDQFDNKHANLVIGDTGVGKSTFIQMMLGCILTLGRVTVTPDDHVNSESDDEFTEDPFYEEVVLSENPVQGSEIGNTVHSCTMDPVAHILRQILPEALADGDETEDDCTMSIIDTAGLNDNRGIMQDLQNSLTLASVFQRLRSVRLTMVIPIDLFLKSDKSMLQPTFKAMIETLSYFFDPTKHASSLALIVTKSDAYEKTHTHKRVITQLKRLRSELSQAFPPESHGYCIIERMIEFCKQHKDNIFARPVKNIVPVTEQIQEITKMLYSLCPIGDVERNLSTPMYPRTKQLLEKKCIQEVNSMLTMFPEDGCRDEMVSSLERLRFFSTVSDNLKDLYYRTARDIASLLRTEFSTAVNSLKRLEFTAAGDAVKKCGSTKAIKALSKEHRDTALNTLYFEFQEIPKLANEMAKQSRNNVFLFQCDVVDHLQRAQEPSKTKPSSLDESLDAVDALTSNALGRELAITHGLTSQLHVSNLLTRPNKAVHKDCIGHVHTVLARNLQIVQGHCERSTWDSTVASCLQVLSCSKDLCIQYLGQSSNERYEQARSVLNDSIMGTLAHLQNYCKPAPDKHSEWVLRHEKVYHDMKSLAQAMRCVAQHLPAEAIRSYESCVQHLSGSLQQLQEELKTVTEDHKWAVVVHAWEAFECLINLLAAYENSTGQTESISVTMREAAFAILGAEIDKICLQCGDLTKNVYAPLDYKSCILTLVDLGDGLHQFSNCDSLKCKGDQLRACRQEAISNLRKHLGYFILRGSQALKASNQDTLCLSLRCLHEAHGNKLLSVLDSVNDQDVDGTKIFPQLKKLLLDISEEISSILAFVDNLCTEGNSNYLNEDQIGQVLVCWEKLHLFQVVVSKMENSSLQELSQEVHADSFSSVSLQTEGIDKIKGMVKEYALRILTEGNQFINDMQPDKVKGCLQALDLSLPLDTILLAQEADSGHQPGFIGTKETLISGCITLFQILVRDIRDLLKRDQLMDAEVTLRKIRNMELLSDYLPMISMKEEVDQARQEFLEKKESFMERATQLLEKEKFDDLLHLIDGADNRPGTEVRSFLDQLHERIQTRHNDFANKLLRALKENDFKEVSETLRWFQRAAVLSPLFQGVFEGWLESLRSMTQKVLLTMYRKLGDALVTYRFFRVYELYQQLETSLSQLPHAFLEIEGVSLRDRLQVEEQKINEKINSVPESLEQALQNGEVELINSIFEGIRDAKNSEAMNDSELLSKVASTYSERIRYFEEELKSLCEAVMEQFSSGELEAGYKTYKRICKIKRANVAREFFETYEEIDSSQLKAILKSTATQMFTTTWLESTSIAICVKQLEELRKIQRVMYNTLCDTFMEHAIRHESANMQTKLDQDEFGMFNSFSALRQIFYRFHRFSQILLPNKNEIRNHLENLEDALVQRIEITKANLMRKRRRDQNSEWFEQNGTFFLEAKRILVDLVIPNTTTWYAMESEQESDEKIKIQLQANGENRVRKLTASRDHVAACLAIINPEPGIYVQPYKTLILDFQVDQEKAISSDEYNKFLTTLRREAGCVHNLDLDYEISLMNAIQHLVTSCSEHVIQERFLAAWKSWDLKTIRRMYTNLSSLLTVNALSTHQAPISIAKDVLIINFRESTKELETKAEQLFHEAMNEVGQEQKSLKINQLSKTIEKLKDLEEYTVAILGPREGSLAETVILKVNLVTDKAKAVCLLEMGKAPSQSEQAAFERFIHKIAGCIINIYETSALLSDDEINDHTSNCISSLLDDIVKTKTMSLTALGVHLAMHGYLGEEIVKRFGQFATDLRKRWMQDAKLTPEDALTQLVEFSRRDESNKISDAQKELLQESFATYQETFKYIVDNYLQYPVDRAVTYIKTNIIKLKGKSSSELRNKLVRLIAGVSAVWAIQNTPKDFGSNMQPHPAQIFAVMRFLQIENPDDGLFRTFCRLLGGGNNAAALRQGDSHMAQVLTGQGKSMVLGITAVVLALCDYNVDCVCYSQYLSMRDNDEFDGIFKLFDVRNRVRYGTFQEIIEKRILESGDVRKLSLSLIQKNFSKKPSEKKEIDVSKSILLIDEVDVFFDPDFYGNTYNPTAKLELDEITEIQRFIWECKDETISNILGKVKLSGEYSSLLEQTRPEAREIIDTHLHIMVVQMKEFLSNREIVPYKVILGEIAYQTKDSMSAEVSFGYLTLWTYFHEHERDPNSVKGESVTKQTGIRLLCGSFSYAAMPARYKLILGVTGTLSELGDVNSKIMKEQYNVQKQTYMPSIFGSNRLKFNKGQDVHVESTLDNYYVKIKSEIELARGTNRPVLVYFEDEKSLIEWETSPYGRGTFEAGVCEKILTSTRNIDHYIRRASRPGAVTLLSREHGRGLDFKSPGVEVEAKGGIQVIQTFFSEEASEETQIKGRTARQGKQGSYVLVLLAESLAMFDMTEEDIQQAKQGQDECLYDVLVRKRNKYMNDISSSRSEAVNIANSLHQESESAQKALVEWSSANQEDISDIEKKSFTFLNKLNCQGRKGGNVCRLLLLFDATGSMRPLWSNTSQVLQKIVSRTNEIAAGKGELLLKVVAYRDYDCLKSKKYNIIQSSEYTSDPAKLIRFINKITCARGGGDGPEAVEKGLEYINNEPELPTRVLLFADAPGHRELQGQEIEAFNRIMDTDYTIECSKLSDSGVPVYPFYLDQYAKEHFEEIAELTGGTASSLENIEQDSSQLLDAICLQALDDLGGDELTLRYQAQYVG